MTVPFAQPAEDANDDAEPFTLLDPCARGCRMRRPPRDERELLAAIGLAGPLGAIDTRRTGLTFTHLLWAVVLAVAVVIVGCVVLAGLGMRL